ncbi:MAG TPA: NDP-sugar synthase [Acidimicrobiales bacterium]|nr:NDP-sugar synthase [Acidimicrobiales bacterium]
MRAIVLVGGEGTRLRPLTYSTPKQMLPVAGRSVIERVVEHLAGHGVDEVVLSLGYHPDTFVLAFPDGCCGNVRLRYAVESSPLDTAGAIAFAAREAGISEETFIVANGDVLTEIDVSALVRFHRSRGAEGTVALTPVEDPSRFGVLPIDPRGLVEAFIEKPPAGEAPTNMINAGIYVLEPSFLSRVPSGRRVSAEREIFPAMVRDATLYALGSDALWTDMGTPEKYLEANLAWASRESHPLDRPAGASGQSHASATIANSVVHEGVVVEEGARVQDSVVLEGGRVGQGAVVRRSLLGRNVIVGPGAVVDELSVLGDGWVVRGGDVLSGARLPAA